MTKSPLDRVLLGLACSSALALLPAVALAAPIVRKAHFDPAAGPNQYEVRFPAELGGGVIFMPIVGGSFDLETDAEASSARLLSWKQDVGAIEIFGKSTGPITVTIDTGSSSEGTFDETTASFSVSATFLIDFDDTELREFGFLSPLSLVGTESGNIYGVGAIGSVRMSLAGEGTVAGSTFNYTCQSSARLEYNLAEDEAQSGDVNHDRSLDLSDAVSMLAALFFGGSLECPLAAEVNQDGSPDISDPVFLLNFLYQGGPPPAATPVGCPAG